ncbi:hypothetical protein DPMN_116436 [Dreissena polymorpha]|uniref:Uncharacterized protein n=1 Tax=Dreissena polymorpha TaxID=45954 RepID=A0A9D4KNK0_DREPO|nr:hypothetical protein DPMN_116436 [Dreissena polymorpha]
MTLVDADFKFMWIVVGGLGSQSDAQIYNQSELKEYLALLDFLVRHPCQTMTRTSHTFCKYM